MIQKVFQAFLGSSQPSEVHRICILFYSFSTTFDSSQRSSSDNLPPQVYFSFGYYRFCGFCKSFQFCICGSHKVLVGSMDSMGPVVPVGLWILWVLWVPKAPWLLWVLRCCGVIHGWSCGLWVSWVLWNIIKDQPHPATLHNLNRSTR